MGPIIRYQTLVRDREFELIERNSSNTCRVHVWRKNYLTAEVEYPSFLEFEHREEFLLDRYCPRGRRTRRVVRQFFGEA